MLHDDINAKTLLHLARAFKLVSPPSPVQHPSSSQPTSQTQSQSLIQPPHISIRPRSPPHHSPDHGLHQERHGQQQRQRPTRTQPTESHQRAPRPKSRRRRWRWLLRRLRRQIELCRWRRKGEREERGLSGQR